jgi:chemotaxis protein CheD
MVRMAEHATSRDPDDVLVSLGLGSCIGLALVDGSAGVAGLAHIVLPESGGRGDSPAGKFADTAVPALIDEVVRLGGRKHCLNAVVCGGAHMFKGTAAASGLAIGERNQEGTLAALAAARIPVRASDVGGNAGRSIEVVVSTGEVRVRAVGEEPRKL